jgi:hypothetical protein
VNAVIYLSVIYPADAASSLAPASSRSTDGLDFVLASVEARMLPAGPAVDSVKT